MKKTPYEYEIKLISIEGNEKIFLVSDYRYYPERSELYMYNSDEEVIGVFSTTKWGFFVSDKRKVERQE